MKALTYFSFAAILAFAFGLSTFASAGVMNRNINYRTDLQASNEKIAVTEFPDRWQHLNRFSRDAEEKGGLSGGITLPSYERELVPKNFRNHY